MTAAVIPAVTRALTNRPPTDTGGSRPGSLAFPFTTPRALPDEQE